MLSKSSVYATIGVKNLEQAIEFYEGKLGLEQSKESSKDTGGRFYTCGNTKIFVYESKSGGTNQATAATWIVDDIESEVKELSSKGIKFEHYEYPGVTHQGDIHVMGDLRAAWFRDPDGNFLNLTNA